MDEFMPRCGEKRHHSLIVEAPMQLSGDVLM